MTSSEIRQKYLDFFSKRGHVVIPAASIVPLDDPTTLFNSSGMQQLVPYLKGEAHPMGVRLVNSQPCFRAEDIEEVGDNRHTTIFEMLGNWSLGDYFKAKQLPWVWEFFTTELGLDSNRLYITVFAGDAGVDEDHEAIKIWQDILKNDTPARSGNQGFDSKSKIYTYASNWWSRAGAPDKMPVGEIGGPDSEIFYDFGEEFHIHENSIFKDKPCHVNCDCGRFLEIGNSVFMQFTKTKNGMQPLPAQNVDFGGGFERIVAVVNNTPDIFTTDLFIPIISSIEESSGKKYKDQYMSSMRVIADHLRAATFMTAQGVLPSNKMQGHILRRLIRRAAVRARILGADVKKIFTQSIPVIIKSYSQAGFISADSIQPVIDVISQELDKFNRVLDRGEKEIQKKDPSQIDEKFAFDLYQNYGFPFEITVELLAEKNITLNQDKFDKIFDKHKQQSRSSSAGMFKGGLADQSEDVIKLHTATHLLHKSLQIVLGNQVRQEGSNITSERLRFDYYCKSVPTKEQLDEVEALMNQNIRANLSVIKTIETKNDAISSGATAFFRETYPEKVSVYTIGNGNKDKWFSKELCGGPHVDSTGQIGAVTIKKDKSIGSNIRRIYVMLKSAHGNKKHSR